MIIQLHWEKLYNYLKRNGSWEDQLSGHSASGVLEKSGFDSCYPEGKYKCTKYLSGNVLDGRSVSWKIDRSRSGSFMAKEWIADAILTLAQAQQQEKMLGYFMTLRRAGILLDVTCVPTITLKLRTSNGSIDMLVIINSSV